MNFQVTILKILVSYQNGFATIVAVKRDMAILATRGREWSERTKRLGAKVPNLDIFSQRLVVRLNGGWQITHEGRSVLSFMEGRELSQKPVLEVLPLENATAPVPPLPQLAERALRRRQRRERRRDARQRARATASQDNNS